MLSDRLLLLGLAGALLVPEAVGRPRQDVSHALAVAREVERLAQERVWWPGFDPLAVPLAIYDGQRSYLFRHPAGPPGFALVPGAEPRAYVYEGRHPAITANSSADLAGVATATVLADGPRSTNPRALAAVALHEAFHVYQRSRHPDWSGNEVDHLTYPIDDAQLLAGRRLETEALRRALAAHDSTEAACWARSAMAFRADRFARMEEAFSAYERLTELNEGLAAYLQLVASGRGEVAIPREGFAAADVRARTYLIGPAMAVLLDRFEPGWPMALEAGTHRYLDEVLGASVRHDDGVGGGGCAFEASELASIERRAERDVAALALAQVEQRRAFDRLSGGRVIVRAARERPLWPQGFDPLNVERIDGGLLHTRFLRLGNESGQLTVIAEAGVDVRALTTGVGPHPLFNGVRSVTIAGITAVEVERTAGGVAVRGPGLVGTFEGATVEERDGVVVIELAPPQ